MCHNVVAGYRFAFMQFRCIFYCVWIHSKYSLVMCMESAKSAIGTVIEFSSNTQTRTYTSTHAVRIYSVQIWKAIHEIRFENGALWNAGRISANHHTFQWWYCTAGCLKRQTLVDFCMSGCKLHNQKRFSAQFLIKTSVAWAYRIICHRTQSNTRTQKYEHTANIQ